jgi:hypothetical protein
VQRHVVLLVAVAAAVALLTSQATPAAHLAVVCGQTIAADTTLVADLRCPASGAALIVQSGTLNLNGHVVSGSGTGVGVLLAGAGTALVNGTVRKFDIGVSVTGTNTLIRNARIAGNTRMGVTYREFANPAMLDASTIVANGEDGVQNAGDSGVTVQFSTISRNGGSGIEAQPHADGGFYHDNRIARNAGYGISASLSFTKAMGNVLARNGLDGIHFQETADPGPSPFYVIQDNLARFNGGVGISACLFSFADPCAPGMIDGGGNRAYGNTGSAQCINIVCAGHARANDPSDDD